MGKTQLKDKCAYNGCTNNRESGVRFFNFPKDEHRRQQWIEACGNSRLRGLADITVMRNYYICSNHFEAGMYSKILSPFKLKLRVDAVPKKFQTSGW